MTIDERLDRLTERHEALTQSVELLLRDTQEQTRLAIEQTRQISEHTRQISEQTRQISEHTRQVGALRDASTALLKIAQTHENHLRARRPAVESTGVSRGNLPRPCSRACPPQRTILLDWVSNSRFPASN